MSYYQGYSMQALELARANIFPQPTEQIAFRKGEPFQQPNEAPANCMFCRKGFDKMRSLRSHMGSVHERKQNGYYRP